MVSQLPAYVIFHVPHNSTVIPESIRDQFVLADSELQDELIKMTDHHTLELFTSHVPSNQIVQTNVSRLVVDVERFEDDNMEIMSSRGMGAIYRSKQDGQPLRRELNSNEREALIETWYRPHHQALTVAVDQAINQYGKAVVIDAHSFPSIPLPYELDQDVNRPEICIGTDGFHTEKALEEAMIESFTAAGFRVGLNAPFSGAMVPTKHYQKDKRVSAAMIEVRRDLYLNEATGLPLNDFKATTKLIRECWVIALNYQL